MPVDSTRFIIYKGPSMNPTLKDRDLLQTVPYGHRRVRCGDVIVFMSPNDNRSVTHRVVAVDLRGIRTQGDNNSEVDPWVLQHDNITGRVVYAQRRNRQLRIYGGTAGRLFAVVIRSIRIIRLHTFSLLRPFYRYLVRSGVLRKCMSVQTKIVYFNRPAGIELQLLMGRRVIGRRLPESNKWQIHPPFRLFVDETSLPQ